MPSPQSTVPVDQLDEDSDSSSNIVARSDSKRPVEQPLGEPDRLRRPLRQPAGPLAFAVASSSAGGHDLVDQPDALGVGGAEVVAEEDELLRLAADRRGGAAGRCRRRRG